MEGLGILFILAVIPITILVIAINIDNCHESVANDRDGIKCPKCNSDIGDDYEFCTECGVNIKNYNKCPKCKKQISEDMNWCSHCGEKLIINKTKDIKYRKTNKKATTGFILSLVSIILHFVALLSLYLCITSLSEMNEKNEGGKGLAVSGIVISVLYVLVTIYNM